MSPQTHALSAVAEVVARLVQIQLPEHSAFQYLLEDLRQSRKIARM